MSNAYATGYADIKSSLLFGGADYATLGTPSALMSVLVPTQEFTILVRTSRTVVGDVGTVITCSDNSNTSFSITSLGGSAWTLNVGGTSFSSGSGSVQGAVWDSVGLVNRNASGTFMARCVLNANAGTAEVASGAQVCTKDIMIGARRAASNSDSASKYTGWVGTVAIWNRALTDDELHYAMGLLTPDEMLSSMCPSGLICYLPCSERGGTTLHDVVGNVTGTLTSNVFTTAAYPKPPVVSVGDSLANGSGSPTGRPFVVQAFGGGSGVRNMRATKAYGFSGQNCAYVLSQMQLTSYAPFLSWTHIMQPGAHDFTDPTVNSAFITNVRSMLKHNRWFVLGQRCDGVGAAGAGDPTSAGACDYGTTRRAQFDNVDYELRAYAGKRYQDTKNLAVSMATLPTEANDVRQLRTPVHLCADTIHPLDAFYIAESVAMDALLNSFGC